MKIEKAKLEDLISPEYNPRKIKEKDLEKLKQSITEFGYVEPIIVNKVNNHIVGGNQRAYALDSLGYTEVDVIYITEENINKEKSLNIALNKISGDWDTLKLEEILNELETDDLLLTGFDENELNLYLDGNLNLDDLLEYEDEYDLPSDYMDVTGSDANKNYVLSIGFTSQEECNEFLEKIGFPKRMTRDTLQVMFDELNLPI